MSRARKASVTIAIEAYSIPASSGTAPGTTSPSSRLVGRAGVASTTASASTVSASRVEPTTRRQPPSGPCASSRTVASVRTSRPAWVASAPGSRPSPPTSPAKTGTSDVAALASAAARISDLSRSSSADDLGDGRARGQLAGVTGVDATEQRLDEPVHHLLAEPLLDQPADADVLVVDLGRGERGLHGGPGQCRVGRARPASCLVSVGTPMSVGGIGRIRPRDHSPAETVAGCTSRSPSPASRARSTASGRRFSIASAPTSTTTPPTSASSSLPPTCAVDSSTVTSTWGALRRTAAPAASPAMPPPTTTTRGRRAPDCGVTGHRLAKVWALTGTGLRSAASQPRQDRARDGVGHGRQSGGWHRRRAAVAAVVAMVALTGCSGGSGDGEQASDAAGVAQEPASAGACGRCEPAGRAHQGRHQDRRDRADEQGPRQGQGGGRRAARSPSAAPSTTSRRPTTATAASSGRRSRFACRSTRSTRHARP